MKEPAIKSMKLYSRVERILDDLRHLGIDDGDPLTVDDLTRFDQYHYFGTDAVDKAIRELGIRESGTVLEIGSGLGGPARYLAHRTGCHVTAIELQPDLHQLATSLTGRCGLSDRVDHVCGDVLTTCLPENTYDSLVSWLALYHIREHSELFPRCFRTMKSGGMLYIEDLFRHGEFSVEEQRDLAEKLYGQNLPLRDDYIEELRSAGFDDIRFTDLTREWAAFVVDRPARYRNNRDRNVSVHGPEVVAALDEFYQAVARLFRGGRIGGVRLVATKP